MSDSLMRQWNMLKMIPRAPAKISTEEINKKLLDMGFEASQRTIQRDLVSLSTIYPLVRNERIKPYGWAWMHQANAMDIPGMDSDTALSFWLAGQYLEHMMPTTTLDRLQPHINAATHVLDNMTGDKGPSGWRNKVRIVSRGPSLLPSTIAPDIHRTVYDALLFNRRLAALYRSRDNETKEYELNPLGLVLKEGVIYLICSIWEYTDIRQLALHRFISAEALDKPTIIPSSFQLDEYIASGELGFSLGKAIKVRALFSEGASIHLEERPLSNDQVMTPQPDKRILIEATVLNTSELTWWFLGFGDQVEVLAPSELRNSISKAAINMASLYSV